MGIGLEGGCHTLLHPTLPNTLLLRGNTTGYAAKQLVESGERKVQVWYKITANVVLISFEERGGCNHPVTSSKSGYPSVIRPHINTNCVRHLATKVEVRGEPSASIFTCLPLVIKKQCNAPSWSEMVAAPPLPGNGHE